MAAVCLCSSPEEGRKEKSKRDDKLKTVERKKMRVKRESESIKRNEIREERRKKVT